MQNARTNFVQKEETKVISTTASKNDKTRTLLKDDTEKGNTELPLFTKIMKQNTALPSLLRNEKKNEARNSSLMSQHSHLSAAVNNGNVNDLKPPSPALWTGKKKNSFANGHKCNNLANNNNEVIVLEDDDLIPPTPSPAGQHSFINCRSQRSASSASEITAAKVHDHLSATNYYNSEQGEKDGKESFVPDVLSTSYNSLETQSTTCTTSRKKYKFSRKGKPLKVISSPLKGRNICGSTAKSPKNPKHVVKGTEEPDQKDSTPVIAPSKCVLRSRMKRSAAKGSSPLQKRLQTELPLPAKVQHVCLG